MDEMNTQQAAMERQLDPAAFLVPGEGEGPVLATDTPLSFWGGVDPASGEVIDQHHPLTGKNLTDQVLVMPHGRGSCTGSVVLFEAIHAGKAPAAILLRQTDTVIGLGAIVAHEVAARAVPVVVLHDTLFQAASKADFIRVHADGTLQLFGDVPQPSEFETSDTRQPSAPVLQLSERDQQRLAGKEGKAMQVAMRIIRSMAQLEGATQLLDVTRVHIDACIYTGPAGLAFAQQLVTWGGKVSVPTSLNAISIDRRQWRELGVPAPEAEPAAALADAYGQLGAQPTYTCAPYLLDDPPVLGENIAWAESNAVVYANSVLGARTDKTPDLLDACIALTGRAPLAGYYRDAERRARVIVDVPPQTQPDDALFPLLGYLVGMLESRRVPVITGLDKGWTRDALKAFGAAFATTSGAGMFHIVGVTPEAPTLQDALGGHAPERHIRLTQDDVTQAWQTLTPAAREKVDLIALGNPHFSVEEFARLMQLCDDRQKAEHVEMVITTSRHVVAAAEKQGYLEPIRRFGVRIVTDTCWCMLQEPVIAPTARVIVTNSAKYAHYGPGLVRRTINLANLETCVACAISGRVAASHIA